MRKSEDVAELRVMVRTIRANLRKYARRPENDPTVDSNILAAWLALTFALKALENALTGALRVQNNPNERDHDQAASQIVADLLALKSNDFVSLRKLLSGNETAVKAFETMLEQLDLSRSAAHCRPLGVLTALECEFQSVVRRMDFIIDSSHPDESYGWAILDRDSPTDDMKEIRCSKFHPKKPLESENERKPKGSTWSIDPESDWSALNVGWALGEISGCQVLAVCASAGIEKTEEALSAHGKAFERYENRPFKWVVVGVCAGTTAEWPLGHVLISSSGFRYANPRSMMIDTAKGWEIGDHRQSEAWESDGFFGLPADFEELDCVLFRKVPSAEGVEGDLEITSDISTSDVMFICSEILANNNVALHDGLIPAMADLQSGHHHFGVEMEAEGVVRAFPYPKNVDVSIIKAVCDYGDDRKAKEWSHEFKTEIQLFAAETAAEVLRLSLLAKHAR